MSANKVDVHFYISLDQQSGLIDDMASSLSQLPGVTRAITNPRVPRLLDVEFDPGQLSSQDLLQYVKKSGYPAAMVER